MSEESTPDELNAQIAQAYAHLYDVNSILVSAGRQEVEDLSRIRDAHLELADLTTHIMDLLIQGIALTAKTTGDILMSQYGTSPGVGEDVSDDDRDD